MMRIWIYTSKNAQASIPKLVQIITFWFEVGGMLFDAASEDRYKLVEST